MTVYEDLFKKYGHIMYADDLSKELRIAIGTIRNRNSKGTLPFATSKYGNRIGAKTIDVAKYLGDK